LISSRNLATKAGCGNAAYKAFKQEVHTLKGMGQSFGFGSVTMICRRLELYLIDASAQDFVADVAIERFLSALDGIVEAGEEPDDDTIDDILDALPEPLTV